MRLVFVDAWDSFARTLAGVLVELGADVRFARCDAVEVDEALAHDAVVLGPGPGRPEEAGCFLDVVRAAEVRGVPFLGVCLGHQALGLALGGRVVRVPPVHGRATPIHHDGTGVFGPVAAGAAFTRYHSLAVDPDTLPAALRVTARSDDGVVQGLAHRTRPMWGVQFHPESVASGDPGRALLGAFLTLARDATASRTATGAERPSPRTRTGRAGSSGTRPAPGRARGTRSSG